MYDQLVMYPLQMVKDFVKEVDQPTFTGKKVKDHYYRNIERSSVLVSATG